MKEPIKYDIETVLKYCRECEISIENNPKNVAFRFKTKATKDEVKNIIRTLEKRHLSKEPVLAKGKRYKNHYLYEFKKMAFDKYWV